MMPMLVFSVWAWTRDKLDSLNICLGGFIFDAAFSAGLFQAYGTRSECMPCHRKNR